MSYKNHEVYKAHESLGFPEISKLEQFQMIVEKDFTRIREMIPEWKEKGFPMGILKEYITITKEELKSHLLQINYIERQIQGYSKTYDGFWIKKTDSGFEFFERERGIEFNKKMLKTEDEVLDAFIGVICVYCK